MIGKAVATDCSEADHSARVGVDAHLPASCADAATAHRTATAKINNFFIFFSFGIGLQHQIYEKKTSNQINLQHIYLRRTIYTPVGSSGRPPMSTHEYIHIYGMATLTPPLHAEKTRLRNIRLLQKIIHLAHFHPQPHSRSSSYAYKRMRAARLGQPARYRSTQGRLVLHHREALIVVVTPLRILLGGTEQLVSLGRECLLKRRITNLLHQELLEL